MLLAGRMRGAGTVALLALLALLATLAASPPARAGGNAARPFIHTLSALPGQIPPSGARVVVRVEVEQASSCSFFSQHTPHSRLYPVVTLPCTSGVTAARMPIVVNRSVNPIWVRYLVEVRGPGGTVRQAAQVIEGGVDVPVTPPPPIPTPPTPIPVPTPPTPTPPIPTPPTPIPVPTPPTPTPPTVSPAPVSGVSFCSAGPDCLLGPYGTRYPTYQNAGPGAIGDCTFAAAADWEQIVRGAQPNPAQVVAEFADAGGDNQLGLAYTTLFHYWQTHGIGGMLAGTVSAVPTDKASVEQGVRTQTALMADFQFTGSQGFGPFVPGSGGHMAVIDGFTPLGPLVVTWGATYQLSWEQWNAEIRSLWAVGST